ncbi:MAG: hypothetical protein JNJ61_03220 [Anaerolineae bacterium]|nr:hypothetical protein [Anaerolineae bacterium]
MAVALTESTGANTTRFVHAPRAPQAGFPSVSIHAHKDAANNWEYPLQDGLGSVRGVASNAAAVLESRNYEPFGASFGATGTSQTPYGFTGEPTDSNGLVYLRARYYSPALGVFPSRDPFEGVTDRPLSLNGYSWVEGNVPNWTDPSGECPMCLVAVGLVALAGIAAGAFLASQVSSNAFCQAAPQYPPGYDPDEPDIRIRPRPQYPADPLWFIRFLKNAADLLRFLPYLFPEQQPIPLPDPQPRPTETPQKCDSTVT